MTHPDALLDQVVLVALQLGQQAVRLDLVGALLVVKPRLVKGCLGLQRRRNSQALDGFPVPLGITSPLSLGDGSFEGVHTEGHRTPANEKQTVKPGAA